MLHHEHLYKARSVYVLKKVEKWSCDGRVFRILFTKFAHVIYEYDKRN